jgi:hypothetical protein
MRVIVRASRTSPVRHGPHRAPRTPRRRQQLAPLGDGLGRPAARQHRDVAGLGVVDQRDLDVVGVLARPLAGARLEQPGADAAKQRDFGVDRADER